jgi:hypothetical protein
MEPGVLRVCADPDNMPFSNEAREGFENRLADMLATAWNSELRYIWWAAPRGLFARALNGSYCDVILQAPTEYDMAGVTRPYYRTGYVVVQRADAPHMVTSLDDPVLKTMRIGVHLFANDAENSPAMVPVPRRGRQPGRPAPPSSEAGTALRISRPWRTARSIWRGLGTLAGLRPPGRERAHADSDPRRHLTSTPRL